MLLIYGGWKPTRLKTISDSRMQEVYQEEKEEQVVSRWVKKQKENDLEETQYGKTSGTCSEEEKDYNHQESLTSMMKMAHHAQTQRNSISTGEDISTKLMFYSQFDVSEVERVCEREVNVTLGRIPSTSEVMKALGELKLLGILISSSRKENSDFTSMLQELIKTAWEAEAAPQEWVDAILVPIPKKGNQCSCDNWRGMPRWKWQENWWQESDYRV